METLRPNSRSFKLALMAFGFFWILVVGFFDAILLSQLARERRARDTFVQADGIVVSSEVVRNDSSDGATYGAEVVYRFDVGGRSFEGDRYAYTAWSSSDRSEAQRTVSRYPVGSPVTVHYDPADPQESVLDVSGQAFPRFLPFFLIPFHCVGLGLVYLGVRGMLRRLVGRGDDPDRARHTVSDRPGRTVIRFHRVSAVLCGLGGTGIVAFVMIFVIALGSGMNPGGRILEYSAALAAAAFFVGFGVGWWLDARPSNRLLVDAVRGEYRLKSRPAAPTGEVVGVEVISCATGMTGLPFGREVRFARTEGGPLTVCRTNAKEHSGDGLVRAIRGAFGLPEPVVVDQPG